MQSNGSQAKGRKGDWMLTHSGIQFWPLDPRPQDILIADIAHSLALQCRFAGHCRFHYSVAQHSVMVSKNVEPQAAVWGLLHDAAEAYLVDLPRPIKRFSALGDIYRPIEDALMECIAKRFDMGPMPESIKIADDRCLMTEKRDIMPGSEKPWRETADPYPERIISMTPSRAEYEFLARWDVLMRTPA